MELLPSRLQTLTTDIARVELLYAVTWMSRGPWRFITIVSETSETKSENSWSHDLYVPYSLHVVQKRINLITVGCIYSLLCVFLINSLQLWISWLLFYSHKLTVTTTLFWQIASHFPCQYGLAGCPSTFLLSLFQPTSKCMHAALRHTAMLFSSFLPPPLPPR